MYTLIYVHISSYMCISSYRSSYVCVCVCVYTLIMYSSPLPILTRITVLSWFITCEGKRVNSEPHPVYSWNSQAQAAQCWLPSHFLPSVFTRMDSPSYSRNAHLKTLHYTPPFLSGSSHKAHIYSRLLGNDDLFYPFVISYVLHFFMFSS